LPTLYEQNHLAADGLGADLPQCPDAPGFVPLERDYAEASGVKGDMKSPCRGCDLEDADKNNPECVGCDKRVEFCVALGSLGSNVPDELTDYVRGPLSVVSSQTTMDNPEGKMTEKQTSYTTWTKICSRPDCEHGQKPQALDNFHKASKGKLGRQAECKDCRRKLAKAVFEKKKAAKGGSKREVKMPSPNTSPATARSAVTSEIIVPARDQYSLTLDFSGIPEIMEKLRARAKEQLREVEKQALYILRKDILYPQ
jgi:hypothetical protein